MERIIERIYYGKDVHISKMRVYVETHVFSVMAFFLFGWFQVFCVVFQT